MHNPISIQNQKCHTKCNRCSGRVVEDFENNERICSKCGIVIEDKEEIFIKNSERCNAISDSIVEQTSLITYEINLSTMMDSKNVDALGNKIFETAEIKRLRRMNLIALSNPKTRALGSAIREIKRIVHLLGLNNTVSERSAYIYRKAMKNNLIKGRSISGISAAVVFIACSELGIPCSILDIKKQLKNVRKSNILHYYKFILNQLNMNVGTVGPSQIVGKIAKNTNLSMKTERKAIEILEKIKNDPVLAGKKPNSLAAASLYLASKITKEHTTQLRLANGADITPMTIRKRFLEMEELWKTVVCQNEPKPIEKIPLEPIITH